jgi:rhamnosyl/mannosyltransferase
MSNKKKLHILEVNKFYYPHIGGIESVIEYHSEYFNSREDTEVKVLVCQEKGKASLEDINGVSVYKSASIGTYFSCPLSFDFINKFRKMAKWADIIEIHVPFPLGDLACLLSGYKGKVVISWHSDIIKQKKLLFFYKPLLMKFLKRADMIITATENHIKNSSFLPEFEEKCTVIPYGIDTDKYLNAPCENILTEKLNDKNAVKFLFVGRLVYYKGIDILIDAFSKIADNPYELFIAGTGALENQIKETVKNNHIENKVHFLGALSDKDLKSAFSDCDIFVFPSVENSEAFGIVQLEAMIYSKPVINTSLPTGVPLVSCDEETGITVKFKDADSLAKAMKKLADNPDLRAEYGENARKRTVLKFSQKTNNQKLYDCFEKLVNNEK